MVQHRATPRHFPKPPATPPKTANVEDPDATDEDVEEHETPTKKPAKPAQKKETHEAP